VAGASGGGGGAVAPKTIYLRMQPDDGYMVSRNMLLFCAYINVCCA